MSPLDSHELAFVAPSVPEQSTDVSSHIRQHNHPEWRRARDSAVR
jgi:hypothetical protein